MHYHELCYLTKQADITEITNQTRMFELGRRPTFGVLKDRDKLLMDFRMGRS